MEFLTWLENLAVVTWVRESDSLLGYTLFLAGHTIGLVFLVGPNLVIAARVLGLAPDLALAPLAKFRPLMSIGLWVTVVTGLVLFATAPVSYSRNLVFIVKIAAIVAAVIALRFVLRTLFAGSGDPEGQVTPAVKRATAATVVLWLIAVVAGRLTAYSGIVVLASLGAFFSALVVAGFIAAAIRLVRPRRAAASPAMPLEIHPTPANGGK